MSNLLHNSPMGNLIMTKHIKLSVCERESSLDIFAVEGFFFFLEITMQEKWTSPVLASKAKESQHASLHHLKQGNELT